MRFATVGELAVLAALTRMETVRVKVENGSGTMIDVSSWVESVKWDHDIDQPVSGLVVEFRRDHNSVDSLSPLRTDSNLNRNDLGFYAPLLDVGRHVTVEVATTLEGVAIVAGDYKLLFDGYEDVVNFEHSPVSISVRDAGGVLVDRWVESVRPYGSTTGIPLEDVIQQIHDDNLVSPESVPVYTPVSPAYVISPVYNQQTGPISDADQALVQLKGWDLRYKWDDGTSSFRYTLYEPPRSTTTPLYTFGPSDYFDVSSLFVDRTNIRNVIIVSFLDRATQARKTAGVTDATSISRYGRKTLLVTEGDTSPIGSTTQATDMANAMLSDLKDPKAEQEIEMPFFWPMELGDFYEFSPNGVHYNSPQQWAVVSFHHELSRKKHRTTVQVRGQPAGAYLNWIGRVNVGPNFIDTGNRLFDFKIIAETDTTVTYGWTPGGTVAEVWMGQVLFTLPVPDNPWDIVLGLLPAVSGATVISPMGPLPDGTTSVTLTKPFEGTVLFVQIEPRDQYLTPGLVQRVVPGAPPSQPPLVELDDSETSTVGTQWIKLTERGIAVTSVEVQTQIGTQPVSTFGPPTRSEGGASVVRGGLLGHLEYEHDVPLDPSRFSWIMPRVNLFTFPGLFVNPPIVLGPFGFDKGKIPDFISCTVLGTVITALADSGDTKSIRIFQVGGTWEYVADGRALTADVALTGTNGVAGLGASAGATYTVQLRSDPTADVDVNTLITSRDLVVYGASAPPSGASWVAGGVNALAPLSGSDEATIVLKASAAPASWSVVVYIDVSVGGGTPSVDHTADLSPALSAPPTTSTAYTYHTHYFRTTADFATLKTMTVQADLLDDLGVVVDSKTATASWYAGEFS